MADGASLVSLLLRCDTARVSLMGHSFGGSTVCLAAAPSAGLPTGPPAAVVLLDPWAGCMAEHQIRDAIVSPTLCIHSEDWQPKALDSPAARALLESASSLRAALVLRDTIHQSVSDVMNWVPGVVARRIGGMGPNESRHDAHRAAATACAAHISQALRGQEHSGDGHWHEKLDGVADQFKLLFE